MSPGPTDLHHLSQAVLNHAAQHGVSLTVVRFPAGTRTAQQAADAIGVALGAIVKSLVFMVADAPWMVLVAGDRRVDEAKLQEQMQEPVRRASADEVRRATGAAIGGVAPFGHTMQLPTLVDTSLHRFPVVWAAAGTPDSVFALTPDQLKELCHGQDWATEG